MDGHSLQFGEPHPWQYDSYGFLQDSLSLEVVWKVLYGYNGTQAIADNWNASGWNYNRIDSVRGTISSEEICSYGGGSSSKHFSAYDPRSIRETWSCGWHVSASYSCMKKKGYGYFFPFDLFFYYIMENSSTLEMSIVSSNDWWRSCQIYQHFFCEFP